MRLWVALVLGACVVAATVVDAATLYQWTDSRGIRHFSDKPPPSGVRAERIRTSSGGDTSAALRERRCGDFRHALEQLEAVGGVPDDDGDWRTGRRRARAGIERWCD